MRASSIRRSSCAYRHNWPLGTVSVDAINTMTVRFGNVQQYVISWLNCSSKPSNNGNSVNLDQPCAMDVGYQQEPVETPLK